jgi:pyrroloquinoline quinone (PQQ) biosynthesis protein C
VNEVEWRERLGGMVREYIRSPELEHYFSIRMTKPRAAIMVKQQSLFVRHRRECWAHVSANCPVLAIKQRILEHEFEEIIRDDFSEYGHLHLIIRQGKSVGLEPEEILNAEPLPETRAVLYAWSWMTSEMSWIEALAGMTITEWCNDDRLRHRRERGTRDPGSQGFLGIQCYVSQGNCVGPGKDFAVTRTRLVL